MTLSLDVSATQVGTRRTAQRIAMLQARLGVATQEVATGMKADVSGELGARASVLLGLRADYDRAGQYRAGSDLLAVRLDTAQDALTGVRDATGALALRAEAALGRGDAASLEAVRLEAASALQSVGRMLNGAIGGRFLFAGSAVGQPPLKGGAKVDGFVGATIDAHATVAGGTIGTIEVDALVAELDAVFDDSHPDPARRFQSVYYDGSDPAEPPLKARIDETADIAYGIKASDPAFRDLLQGLHMLAGLGADDGRMSDEARATFLRDGLARMQRGHAGVSALALKNGVNQAALVSHQERLDTARTLYNTQIVELEGRDPYEASLRLSALEQQMEATFAVTARLADLSLLTYLR